MISGLVPFESIVESVRDETGYTNMTNLYDRIRRLIFRAEREIGYGGSVVLKRRDFIRDVNYTGNFIKYPEDFIEFEAVGSCENGMPRKCDYLAREGGIRVKNVEGTKKLTLLYWALMVDGHGFPIVTRNHEEAVIAFIVWKLYSAKVFVGQGNFNMKKDYEYHFNSLLLASRGHDAFPTIEEYAEIGHMTMMDRRYMVDLPGLGYSFCSELEPEECVVPEPGENPVFIYYWQLDNPVDDIDDVIVEYELDPDGFFLPKPFYTPEQFSSYIQIDYTSIGRICFGIRVSNNENWTIIDSIGNDVTDSVFNKHYDLESETLLFVSKSFYSSYSIKFKIVKNG